VKQFIDQKIYEEVLILWQTKQLLKTRMKKALPLNGGCLAISA
jgi:hypothetical protein